MSSPLGLEPSKTFQKEKEGDISAGNCGWELTPTSYGIPTPKTLGLEPNFPNYINKWQRKHINTRIANIATEQDVQQTPRDRNSKKMEQQPPTKKTLYLGYGSNLWQAQMALRCPNSQFVGIGRLARYRWMINSRGYANVAPCKEADDDDQDQEVWGLVYTLTPDDEARLDVNEGVPWAYEKRLLQGEFWGKDEGGKEREMLVYIDFLRDDGEGNKPREEYVHRMNMGIRDALRVGVPGGYVEGVLRRWIPEEDLGEEGDGVRELARKQAARFEDESGLGRTGSGVGL